ncbi:hypothetical protein IE53DRAFT_110794 [Violaceomyces palustris]|uniref:Uncharacterized protein n=1 Tax=Violaceomyces palustris TaxID=1673888 RepID=A0ACD0NWE6_9BASI|nr:hypothetical protein IE53DRAFT_110794 [Violaceomyces palustris]
MNRLRQEREEERRCETWTLAERGSGKEERKLRTRLTSRPTNRPPLIRDPTHSTRSVKGRNQRTRQGQRHDHQDDGMELKGGRRWDEGPMSRSASTSKSSRFRLWLESGEEQELMDTQFSPSWVEGRGDFIVRADLGSWKKRKRKKKVPFAAAIPRVLRIYFRKTN